MAAPEQVHWHEGLSLQPHHLQAMQRHVLARDIEERQLSWPYPYGVVECEISDDALQNCRVQFDRLHVITRSGREIRVPGNTELPPLDIKQAFEMGSGTMSISLAIPEWNEKRPNVCDGVASARQSDGLYKILESQVFDENTGANPQPILIRRINARLVIDDDGKSQYETLPLLRIHRAAGEAVGRPRQDPDFIPPCLVTEGSAILRRTILAIADQVEASRRELVPQLLRQGFNIEVLRGAQFGQLLKLRTLNRYTVRLGSLCKASGITPFQFYIELRELLGELIALQPDRDELFEMAPYRHDEPALAFFDLAERIRQLLVTVVRQTVLKVEFVEKNGLLCAALTDEQLTAPNEYFLAVTTGGDPTALSRLVEHPDNFKLMAGDQIARAVRGVRLTEERHPPPDLPRQGGLFYYRLDRSADRERAWNDIKADRNKTVAIKRPKEEFPDARFWLYMTIPQLEQVR